jgi:hypothetical protein
VFLGTGWSHRMLSYDGDGSLFGFADDSLRRYTVTSAKPVPGHITNYTTVQSTGYGVIRNLAATGPDHVIGSTGAGALRSYPVPATGVPAGVTLATNSTWGSLDALVSPGRGLYYGRTAAGALLRFRDPAPYDQNGGDIQYFADDPVDRAGWTTPLLAAVPFDAQPQNAVDVSVFGFTADRRLTFTAIDSVTGTRHGSTVVAAEPFPFAPGAIATLNFNTVLVTDPADENRLYRLDIVTTKPALVFNRVPIATGWSHRLLSYDGRGSLFGLAENRLIRYTVRRTKPTGAADFTGRVQVGDGYTLRTFAATAPGYVMGTTGGGELVGYPIDAAGRQVRRDSLAANGWTYPVLFSPGNGNYFARTTAGGVLRFRDPTPTNGQGNDIAAVQGPVDTAGWSQPQLSAQPYVS